MSADPSHAFQWNRELKRREYRLPVAVVFTVPDTELVRAGRFGADGEAMTAAQAVALFAAAESPLGLEVRIPRSIGHREVKALRSVPPVSGWRYFPEAKHRKPFWPWRGERNAARLRRSMDDDDGTAIPPRDIDDDAYELSWWTMRFLGDLIDMDLAGRVAWEDDETIIASLRSAHPDIDIGFGEARAEAERRLSANQSDLPGQLTP